METILRGGIQESNDDIQLELAWYFLHKLRKEAQVFPWSPFIHIEIKFF
jgi:hypothetical protein